MRIGIFGLGYVGAVSSACLAKEGHEVVGVDPNKTKVDIINSGQAPLIEADVEEMIAEQVAAGRLRATDDAAEAIESTQISLICVGTPSKTNGSIDLRFVRQVCAEIGGFLKDKDDFHVVAARSTMLPGTMRSVVIPALEEASGKSAGDEFGVCFNPEFLREGSAVHDFYHPAKTVVGETDERSGDLVVSLYQGFAGDLVRTDVETAEIVKYVDNAWHALKVGFANEIGKLCKRLDLDGRDVMEIFCRDTKLNLSPVYLKPGFAFGGSCLPKDLRALTHHARSADVEMPIVEAILPSNRLQVELGLEMVLAKNATRVGVLGLSFKAGTDDLRESPIVELVERLVGKGRELKVYDRNVQLSQLVGANREYILEHVPHIAKLMVGSISEVVEHAEVLVIGNADPTFADIGRNLDEGKSVIDLVGVGRALRDTADYEGICW